MVTMFVRHSYADYDAWRTVYDAFESRHAEFGAHNAVVYRTVDNPNEVTVMHDFDDLASAKAFIEGDAVRDAMAEAGVTGEPEVWFGERT
jgi:quinol monooxygenase YgiN